MRAAGLSSAKGDTCPFSLGDPRGFLAAPGCRGSLLATAVTAAARQFLIGLPIHKNKLMENLRGKEKKNTDKKMGRNMNERRKMGQKET